MDNKVPHIIFSLDQFELFGIDSLTFYLSGFKLERFHEDGKEGEMLFWIKQLRSCHESQDFLEA